MKSSKITQIRQIQTYLKEKKLLGNLREDAAAGKIPVIDEVAGRFLEMLCFIKNPKNILEIGCGSGYSSYFLVKNLGSGNYTGIDLNKKRLETAEKFIKSMFPEKNCIFLAGNAIDIITDLKGKYDLVFIDAAKYEYPMYIKSLMGKIETGSIIIADNIFYKGKIFASSVTKHDCRSVTGIKDYIGYITRSRNFKNNFINVGDGLSISKFLGR